MNFIFFLISLLFCFFILYLISKNDFVFLRKNINLHDVFDNMSLSLIAFFIFSRILFIFGKLHTELYGLIAFLHFIRYPGGLYLGGIIGFGLITAIRFRRKKENLFHIFDVYSLSLYPLFLFFIFFSNFKDYFLFFNLFILILSVFLFIFGIYSYRSLILKDGTIALLFLCIISVFTIINEFSDNVSILYMFNLPQVLALTLFIVGSILILFRESLIKLKH